MNKVTLAIIVLLIVALLLWFFPKGVSVNGSTMSSSTGSAGSACQMKRQEGIQGLSV